MTPDAAQSRKEKAAAEAMQRILIDIARRKQTTKHGTNQVNEELHESRIAVRTPSEELLAVNDSLAELAAEDPQAAILAILRAAPILSDFTAPSNGRSESAVSSTPSREKPVILLLLSQQAYPAESEDRRGVRDAEHIAFRSRSTRMCGV